MNDVPDLTNLLIVGGGLTGLALARLLHKRGIDFTLIEARKRLGGRIFSQNLTAGGDVPVDLGPAWIWPGQERVLALAETLNLTLFEQFSAGRMVFEDETGDIRRDIDLSMMAGALRVQGGLKTLIDGLADDLPADAIKTGLPVTSIRQEHGRMIAYCGDKAAYSATRIVLALPPRLAAAKITFEPALAPNILRSMAAIPTWMAGHAKFIAVYDKPFWRDDGLSGDAVSRIGPLAEIHDASPPDQDLNGVHRGALFGFSAVPADTRLRPGYDVQNAALEQLARLFGNVAMSPLETIAVDWAKDPFTASEADLLPPQHHPNYGRPAVLRSIYEDRVILAGTELAADNGGLIEGALASAEEVFHRLMR